MPANDSGPNSPNPSNGIVIEEQDKLLDEALAVVKTQAFQMKRCLDQGKLMDGLKHCSNMLSELRTSALSPKFYYELYMAIFDELRYLASFLIEEHKHGKKMSDLYELVQYAGNIVPRLYLMITVGAVYIETGEAPTKEVLKDMLEMCRGVQHPTRGLFLRHYLSQMTKDKLPDVGADSNIGSVQDSIHFVLTNFTEMNKLWVRLQHQGHSRDREKREKERRELRILVGTNLVRLSQLEGVDLQVYRETVLPSVLEQVVQCKDVIAQEYLMEVIIQVFHDELHLRTLDEFLEAVGKLHKNVNVKAIVIALIDRFAAYASRNDVGETEVDENGTPSRIPSDVALFEIFFRQIKGIASLRGPDMPIEDSIALLVSLLNLSLSCYPKNLSYVDSLFGYTKDRLAEINAKNIDISNPTCGKLLVRLLRAPLEKYDVLTILGLSNFPAILPFLAFRTRKTVAVAVIQSVLGGEVRVPDVERTNKLMAEILSPLVVDQQDGPVTTQAVVEGRATGPDVEDFVEEQNLVARSVHLFYSESSDLQYQLLANLRKIFGDGGPRIRFTLPPLTIAALKLAIRFKDAEEEDNLWEKKCQKVFQFIHQTSTALAKAEHHEISLRLFLQAALAADRCGFETIAYEFIAQAFLIYEESISESKAQFAAITSIIGTVQSTRIFSQENFEPLVTKCAQHASKLLRKPDQCRGVYLCSHLFWILPVEGRDEEGAELFRDGKRVLECLQKSLKIADTCVDIGVNINLFVEILNRYAYYYEKQNEAVAVKHLNGLIDLIHTNLSNADSSDEVETARRYFRNTLLHLKRKKESPEEGPSYEDVDLSILERF